MFDCRLCHWDFRSFDFGAQVASCKPSQITFDSVLHLFDELHISFELEAHTDPNSACWDDWCVRRTSTISDWHWVWGAYRVLSRAQLRRSHLSQFRRKCGLFRGENLGNHKNALEGVEDVARKTYARDSLHQAKTTPRSGVGRLCFSDVVLRPWGRRLLWRCLRYWSPRCIFGVYAEDHARL